MTVLLHPQGGVVAACPDTGPARRVLNHDDLEGVFWRGMPVFFQHALRNSYYFGRFTS